MNLKSIISLFISVSVGVLVPTKVEATVSAQSESVQQLSTKIAMIDLGCRQSSGRK